MIASIQPIVFSIISLSIVLGSYKGTSSGVSETVEFTADVAYKIITCLSAKNIDVCQAKPDMVQVKSCAESSVESSKNIPENVLDQIFKKLFSNRVQTPAFQEELIIQMTHHITEGLTLQNLHTYFWKQTVLATLRQSKLADTEYFEIFCSFKEIVNVVVKYLQLVQNSYDELKNLVEKHPQTDSELHDIKVNALKTKKKMLSVVLKSYDSFRFVFKPTLSHFITMLFFKRAYMHDKLHEGIWDEIEKVLNQIQVFKNDPETNKKVRDKMEGDHSFELLVLEECTRYHSHLHSRSRVSFAISMIFNAIFVVALSVFGIRRFMLFIRKRRYTIRQREIPENYRTLMERVNI